MSQVTIELPEHTLVRFRRGAQAARKDLEVFLAERLAATPLPLADDLPASLRSELAPLEHLDDAALWRLASEQLSAEEQAEYDALVAAMPHSEPSSTDLDRLNSLGDKARRLTLRRAHAYLILKWRGHSLPTTEELAELA